MNRSRLLPTALVAALALSGCEGSETDRLERIQTVPTSAPEVLGGGGASPYVAYVDATGYLIGKNAFRFFRHDATSPDALVEIGGLYPSTGFPPFSDLTISGDTAVLNWGYVHVISLGGDFPTIRWEGNVASVYTTLATAEGRWLLCAGPTSGSDTGLALVDLDAVGGAKEVGVFSTATPVTGLLSAQGQFLAFTEGGYVHVAPDPATPVFTEQSHVAIRGFHRAFADGTEAIVAGPSIYEGKSRVARLDLTTPSSPALVHAGDFAGEYGAFAWDGGDTSILEVQGAPGAGLYQGYRIIEGADAFGAAEISLPQWFGGEAHIAAHAGRLFALEESGMGFYRIH